MNPEKENHRVKIFLHDNPKNETKSLLVGAFKLVSSVSAPNDLATLKMTFAICVENASNLRTIQVACRRGFPLRLSGNYEAPTMISNFDGLFQIAYYEEDDSPDKVVICKVVAKQLVYSKMEDPLTYLQSLAIEYFSCGGDLQGVVAKKDALFRQIMYLLISNRSICDFTQVADCLSQEQIHNRTISKYYAEIQKLREWISEGYYKPKTDKKIDIQEKQNT